MPQNRLNTSPVRLRPAYIEKTFPWLISPQNRSSRLSAFPTTVSYGGMAVSYGNQNPNSYLRLVASGLRSRKAFHRKLRWNGRNLRPSLFLLRPDSRNLHFHVL
ncbi:hypothetical protein L1987_23059 [Smallanthus sonchifolius]|uniref:Uncharacterized protein n=1 Tax=Smallanthus sonchifolius TaxID=185202 RepID=A0ACB9IGJ1_9ASTR|nr:hypothetical protein L1987_23059 [Smallanthus sonchifolius]